MTTLPVYSLPPPPRTRSPSIARHGQLLREAVLGEVAYGIVISIGMEMRQAISNSDLFQLVH